MRAVAVILGLAFAVIAIVYWTMPAGSLPSFVPGYEAGSTLVHVKHGIAAAAVAALCFAYGWYAGGARA
ncbi:MAG TPA: hypothetical protein VKW08_05460 [Xanthobacteraceae bacterium]|jgi:hypothetical protein|nr:hypothetical protein [Xanthobacteraceae bacterium]